MAKNKRNARLRGPSADIILLPNAGQPPIQARRRRRLPPEMVRIWEYRLKREDELVQRLVAKAIASRRVDEAQTDRERMSATSAALPQIDAALKRAYEALNHALGLCGMKGLPDWDSQLPDPPAA